MLVAPIATNGSPFRYRQLWPLFVLLVAELLAYGLLATGGRLPATPLSVAVAAGALAAGLLPALLRPGRLSLLAGCLGVVAAGLFIIPFDFADLPHPAPGATLSVVSGPLLLRLVNGMCIGPLALHLAAGFRPRASGPGPHSPTVRTLAGSYAVTLALLVALLLAPVGIVRMSLFWTLFLWQFGQIGAAVRLLVAASRDLAPENRHAARQARILLVGIFVAAAPILARAIGFFFGLNPVSYDLILAAQVALPLGVAYAILRHDLFGVDAALRRALAYGTLSLLLLALYFGLTVALTALLARSWPQFRGLATVVALFTAAAAFQPLRRRAHRLVDGALYPERLVFQHEIAAARAALARVVRRDEVIALLTERLPRRLGASWASLSLAPAPDLPVQGAPGPAWNAQLIVGGASLGRYWLGPRSSGAPYDAGEQAQLHALAQQAALALAYADTFDTLAALNRELEERVATRTAQIVEQQRALAVLEERRRLARDLHDSVTQTLFSINLSARALRGLVARDPAAAIEGLYEQEAAAQQALVEMRALLAQLRSPLMADGDLAQALAAHCDALERQVGLAVTLNLPPSLVLPEPQASELFHVAKEALHNVVKHSGAPEATCTLSREGAMLVLGVEDRGSGFDPEMAGARGEPGFGLRGLHERVAGLGGTLEILSAPGAGTTVRARVPVEELEG